MSIKNGGLSPLFVFCSGSPHVVVDFNPLPFEGEYFQNEKVTRISGYIYPHPDLKLECEETDSFFKKNVLTYKDEPLFEVTKMYDFARGDFTYKFSIEIKPKYLYISEDPIDIFIDMYKLEHL